jgi:hypothetical protein
MQSKPNALIAPDELFVQTAVARIDTPSLRVNDLVAVVVMIASLVVLCVMCASRMHTRCCLLLHGEGQVRPILVRVEQ